ncbi:MAG TPA: DUF4160 domain-containing protein [Spirochaetota bacterium]|jgi:hypothetical protein|nr:DUF4160 domain-containing protein [Spirochaetota bacterium]HOK03140.1 DUF4160 domain-containing protein [Spirochaetota bacterium]HOK91723.1 DUF4160 domain-containing protein [Spirochaetota bacterium]HON15845.1 DUF4160 domain-containing protein [Spirochaetota bacterium]HPD77515.1 DUF4160 domain-containing protein [Spirochaetota bacterium]
MPEISRFYGIIVRMFTDDHAPPHFHAFYNEFEILMDIEDFRILAGNFPPKALALTIEWAAIHQSELLKNWELACNKKPTFKIDPLI